MNAYVLSSTFGVLILILGAWILSLRHRWIDAVAFVVMSSLMVALWQSSLGLPRTPTFTHPSGDVVSFVLDEPNAIYVWIKPSGSSIPISYGLPWSNSSASALMKAASKAKREGSRLKLTSRTTANGSMPVFLGMFSQRIEYRFNTYSHRPFPPKTPAHN